MNIGVVFAGGVGRRMNTRGMPKQFLEVNGIPIIIHTLRIFQRCSAIDHIVIACVEEYIDTMRELAEIYRLSKVCRIVVGGATGQESIYRGLCAARELPGKKNIVLIHDGVRPLIDEDLLLRNIDAVKRYGSAVSAMPAKETIILSDGGGLIGEATDRGSTYLARAPQSFFLEDILSCHEAARSEGLEFVDSCTLMLHYGNKPFMVETNAQNIKITTPEDFYIFKALLSARENAQILGV